MPPISEIAQAFLIFVMLAANVVGAGLLLVRLAEFRNQDPWITAAAVGGAGLSAFGFAMWLLGYLKAWNQASFCISSGLMMLVIALSLKKKYLESLQAVEKSFFNSMQSNESRYLTLVATISALVAAAACFKPPSNGDEITYHWPAPLLWASAHHWVPSPYRFTNGPSFIELSYLPSALFHSVPAGHLTHFLMWIVLLASCCALSKLLLSSPIPTVAAVIACPVITTQASSMASDIGATCYLVSALTILYSLKNGGFLLRNVLLSAFIFCGGLSSKQPFALGILPLIVLYLWFGVEASNLKDRVVRVLVFLVPCLITELLWLAHTYSLIGKLIDLPVAAIWTSNNQPADPTHPYSGVLGLAGPPSQEKILVLLVTPFLTWIAGNQEPFGNRTGLVVPLFLPVFLFVLRKFETAQKQLGLWMFATSAAYFIAVGIFVIRTRYHLIVWTIWSTLASVGYYHAKNKAQGAKRVLLTSIFLLVTTIGCADSCRTLLQDSQSKQLLPQIPWLLK
ncbi:MAG: hypothetical protein HYX67_06795 [Candidatus Melainabacteria bacterium]|nr:hypothetical protein [Candidatus Melainabacteria bacterium]